ncbi:MAG: hypothetical protein MUF00_00250 [Gemmatimonadaceae bacterium]|jgi:hypothetical protein|nr:hypothetical protein [Gemmatimonadaceae bacterium]
MMVMTAEWTRIARALVAPLAALMVTTAAAAQSADDGFPVERRQLRVTLDHGVDAWRTYWEGTRRRDNENIGTLRTRQTVVSAGFGVTRSLALFAALPYVATNASQGVLAGQQGAQDLSLTAKLRLLETPFTRRGAISAFVYGTGSTPITDYTPDLLPLSIGLGARRATARALLHYQDRTGLFADAAIAHTWRSTVTLDRPAYYTNGRLTLSNEVAMPNVAEYSATVGLAAGPLCLPITFIDSRTLGGGDIRRQDMPFVSNRMNAQRLHVQVMLDLPKTGKAVRLNAGMMQVLHGRNVGLSTMWSGGFTLVRGF